MSQIGWSPVCHIVLVAFTLYLEDYCNKPKSCICSTIGLSGLHPWDCFDQKCVSAGNWTAIARKKALEIELHKVGLTSHRKPKIWQGTLNLQSGHRGEWRAQQYLTTNPEIASDCILVFEDDAKFTPEFVRNRRQILRKTINLRVEPLRGIFVFFRQTQCKAVKMGCPHSVGMQSTLPRNLALWIVRWSVAGCTFPGRSERPGDRLGDTGHGIS